MKTSLPVAALAVLLGCAVYAAQPNAPAEVLPTENFVLTLQGALGDGVPVDARFVTPGPSVSCDMVIPTAAATNGIAQPILAHLQVDFVAVPDGYRVEYAFTAQKPWLSPVPAGGQGAPARVVNVPIGCSSAVKLKLGQPVTVATGDGQSLTIALTPAAL